MLILAPYTEPLSDFNSGRSKRDYGQWHDSGYIQWSNNGRHGVGQIDKEFHHKCLFGYLSSWDERVGGDPRGIVDPGSYCLP